MPCKSELMLTITANSQELTSLYLKMRFGGRIRP